uniref:metallophosphoesterase n=1 Tax=Haliangium sp. TaxID=2663208 RepID=UPI003D0D6AF4
MSRDGTQALIDLLQSLFTVPELRRFLARLPNSGAITRGLSSGTASLADLAFEAVHALQRHGRLDDEFYDQLEVARPGRRSEVAEIRAGFIKSPTPTSAAPSVGAPPATAPAQAEPHTAAVPPAPWSNAARTTTSKARRPTKPTGASTRSETTSPCIRWLHLSDLHAGAEGEPLLHHVFSKLEADIREHAEAGEAPPDLILFTGDLAWSGQAEQYVQVNAHLERIRGWLASAWPGCDDPLLFAVPGNHDLTRPEYDREDGEDDVDVEERLDKYEWLTRYDHEDERVQSRRQRLWKHERIAYLTRPFRHYSEWMERHVRQPLAADPRCVTVQRSFFPGDLSAVITKDGFELGLIGLNSAWVQYSGGDFEGKLQLPVEQFHAALPAGTGGPLDFLQNRRSLLLMHHPPDWLSPRARERFFQLIYDPEHVDACLYGHMHASKSETRSDSGAPMRVFVQSPSLFGLEHYGTTNEDRAFGYSWGEIGAHGGLRIWPRRLMNRDAQVWQFDRDPGGYYRGRGTAWYWLRKPKQIVDDGPPDPGGVKDPTGGNERGSKPDYAAHLPKYAEWARETFRHLPMVGLGGGDLKLTLDEVYVPLAFAPQVHRDPLGYTDKHEARRSTLDTPDKVDIREAFELAGRGRHLFVRGDPGTGKTTALKKMLWSLLDESRTTGFDGRKLGLPAETVPVFLRLRGLAGPMRGRDFGEVLDRALARAIGQTASSVTPPGFGRWLWEQGNLLLLLDGLDEIGQRKEREAVCRYVENLAEAGYDRGIRVVASSRRAGVEGAVDLDHQQFLALDMHPLDDGQIDELVTRWFSAAGRTLSRMKGEHASRGEERARDEAQDLLAKLHRQATARIKGMLSTPLLLTLLCLTVKVKGGSIPQRRVEFFRECLDTLLGRWLTERTGRHLLSLDESLDLLEPVAWYLQTDEKGREDGISEAELRRCLRERINALASDRQRQEAVHFREVLEWFRVHTGVLREVCENHYGFMHLNLQEYLAALHAGHTDEIERLADKLGDPSWRE